MRPPSLLRSLAVLLALAAPAGAQTTPPGSDSMAEIAKDLANPVANLISVPFQNNWDYHLGTTDATLYTLNVQPVIPIGLNERYILVTRTIIPYVSYNALVPGTSGAGGLGDTQASIFLTTREAAKGGWFLGVGPVLQIPTATSRSTGSGKWGAGPTGIVLRQHRGWTYGLLASHTWSFAGTESRASVNSTFLEPFLTYTTKTYTTLGVFTESAYDWNGGQVDRARGGHGQPGADARQAGLQRHGRRPLLGGVARGRAGLGPAPRPDPDLRGEQGEGRPLKGGPVSPSRRCRGQDPPLTGVHGTIPLMKTIGLIGAGHIGSQVARLAVAHGYSVLISNSRGPETLAALVQELGPRARAGTAVEAAKRETSSS